jgi:hypothetical protein
MRRSLNWSGNAVREIRILLSRSQPLAEPRVILFAGPRWQAPGVRLASQLRDERLMARWVHRAWLQESQREAERALEVPKGERPRRARPKIGAD